MRTSAHEREPGRPDSDQTPTSLPAVHDAGQLPEILQLQRTAGNAATARLLSDRSVQPAAGGKLQRDPGIEEVVAKPPLERIREINDQEWADLSERDELKELWAGFSDLETMLLDPGHWADFTASLDVGMALPEVSPLVKIWLVHENAWVDPALEAGLARLWAEYGDELPDKATEYEPTWRTSLDRGMNPDDISVVQQLKGKLEDDVRAVAEQYLTTNLAVVRDERAKLGLGVLSGESEPAAARDELLDNADLLRELLEARDLLRRIVVGRRFDEAASDDGAPDDEAAASDPLEVLFDPTSQPDVAPEPEDAMLPWDVVMSFYGLATSGLLAVASTSPVLYGALESGRLDELDPAADPADVAATVGVLLFELETNILDTRENLEGGLDWHELSPIVGELAQGMAVEGGSGVDWSGPFHLSLVRDEAGDYETVRAFEELGWWLIPAVALMFTPIGWPALVAGGLLTAAEVAVRYERWDDLRAAAGAGTSSQAELVASPQAQAAEGELIMATVIGFLGVAGDVGALALGAARAARPAARAARGEAAPEPEGSRIFSDQEVDQLVEGLENAVPIGKGLRGFGKVSADVDEPMAVSKGGPWDDPANKRFLESTTNRLTKNDLTEYAPSPPGDTISLRNAKAAGPDPFRRAAMAMLDRNFSEVDELAAVTQQARAAMKNVNRPVDELRDAINASIRRRIANASGPEARLVNEALHAIGIDPHAIATGPTP